MQPKASSAVVRAEVTLVNSDTASATVAPVAVAIKNAAGVIVATGSITIGSIGGASSVTMSTNITLNAPSLWSDVTPVLYTAIATLPGASAESASSTFGVRHISFDVKTGFLLNGKPTKFYGGCLHHDNGPLGSKAISRAEERRVQILKKNGYNAIRASHNPVSPAFLDACDREGILVMDEAFDCWAQGKVSGLLYCLPWQGARW
jgi:beta-galactosidase